MSFLRSIELLRWTIVAAFIFRKTYPYFLSSLPSSTFFVFYMRSILSSEMTCVSVRLLSSSSYFPDKGVSYDADLVTFGRRSFFNLELDDISSFLPPEQSPSTVLLPLPLVVPFSTGPLGLSTFSVGTVVALRFLLPALSS